ncbi:MAG: hypothetical protein M3160_00680 [Candidatus Eremiobacteraeota bacterium]|nr:hypothetical protein [Candidatus Eremiobacteraeota bacterium]
MNVDEASRTAHRSDAGIPVRCLALRRYRIREPPFESHEFGPIDVRHTIEHADITMLRTSRYTPEFSALRQSFRWLTFKGTFGETAVTTAYPLRPVGLYVAS